MPTTPQNAAGWRIEPPVSVPIAAGQSLAATAAVGISVGVTAAVAIFRKGERSIHDVLSLLLGGMVLFIVARQLA